jgi:hypothetical protein
MAASITAGLCIPAYLLLTRLFPAGAPYFRTLLLATSGMLLSVTGMTLRIMWLTFGAPDQQRSITNFQVLPHHGPTVLALGWLSVMLPISWPYGASVSLFAIILGILVIVSCHAWSIKWTSRQLQERGFLTTRRSSSHRAVYGLPPIEWTLTERRIGCPPCKQQLGVDGHDGGSPRSSRRVQCGWSWTRGRPLGRRRGSWI